MDLGVNERRYFQSALTIDAFCLSASECERFLQIISRFSRIKRHFELFQLLQGEVQYFIPHQILISAWGDFRGPSLQFDVISAIPGVRTGQLEGCNVDGLLKGLYLRWLANGRRPMLLDSSAVETLAASACDCALHHSLRGRWSILVHGVHNVRDGTDSLYLAANEGSSAMGAIAERFLSMVDPVIAQIDAGFRRVAGLKPQALAGDPSHARALSAREEEILNWISQGRTNLEISEILAISSFTVKNHVQRIIKKLGAANRTEAVAKYRQNDRGMRGRGNRSDAAVSAE